MPSVLITGANRGIGLEFARQYMPLTGYTGPCHLSRKLERGH